MTTKNIIMAVILVSFMPVTGMAMGRLHKPDQTEKQHAFYYCPMHPKTLYDHPGVCPICGMDLIKKDSNTAFHKVGCSCCGMKHS